MERQETTRQQPLFGEYLARLLRERACSGSRLASLVGVDAALVYRWLRNEAVPKLDAPYRDAIILHLALSQSEAGRLKEAQVYSLSLPPEKRAKGRTSGAAVEQLIRHTRPQAPTALLTLPPPSPRLESFPRQSRVIWGRPAMLETIIQVFGSLPPVARHQQREILLSFQGEEDAYDDFPELQVRYQQALAGALQRGWQIRHLWRLDHDTHRSLLLVENMLKLLGTGRYQPSYFHQYGTLAPPYDLLVIPQAAAMLVLATQNPHRADAALLTYDPEQIELLHTHFSQLLAQSQPLVQSYLPQDEVRVWQAYADAEAHPGGRVTVKDGLTFLAEPPSWYQAESLLAPAIQVSRPALSVVFECQQRRYESFQTHITSSTYRDICPKRAIERLIRQGKPPRNDRIPGFRFPAEARRAQLEYTLYVLKTYEHYQLALIDEEEEEMIPTEMFWEVAGGNTVLMLTWSTDVSGNDIIVDLVIQEPTIVRAFQDHFEDLWKRIAPHNKEKCAVIAWLEQQISLLKLAKQGA